MTSFEIIAINEIIESHHCHNREFWSSVDHSSHLVSNPRRPITPHLRQQVVVSDAVLAEAYHALKDHCEIEPEAIRQVLLHMLSSGMVQAETGSAALAVLSEKYPVSPILSTA